MFFSVCKFGPSRQTMCKQNTDPDMSHGHFKYDIICFWSL